MRITMVGIDHSNAPIQVRERFSFTKTQGEKVMGLWKKSGCLLLSTCNRTEFWVSGSQEPRELFQLLCRAKGHDDDQYWDLFFKREDMDAVRHLLQMTCGLKSRIYGEDQILSQVRDALSLSRQCKAADSIIEKLFQTAVTAAKKVKTEVKTSAVHPSAAENGLHLIQETFGQSEGLSCLVIGSGNMGQLAAATLARHGMDVRITQRKRIHGRTSQDPIQVEGCQVIDYEKRLQNIEGYDVVISATASPHYTIQKEELAGRNFDCCLWIDMAVPRDIEPAVSELAGIKLVDMDQIGDYSGDAEPASYREALALLREYEEELEQWFAFRDYIGTVKEISGMVVTDAEKRASKGGNLSASMERAVEKILFGLKDTLPRNQWQACFHALRESAEKETLKR